MRIWAQHHPPEGYTTIDIGLTRRFEGLGVPVYQGVLIGATRLSFFAPCWAVVLLEAWPGRGFDYVSGDGDYHLERVVRAALHDRHDPVGFVLAACSVFRLSGETALGVFLGDEVRDE